MVEIETDKNSLPKFATELEKSGRRFQVYSLARTCAWGDITLLTIYKLYSLIYWPTVSATFFFFFLTLEMDIFILGEMHRLCWKERL